MRGGVELLRGQRPSREIREAACLLRSARAPQAAWSAPHPFPRARARSRAGPVRGPRRPKSEDRGR